MKNRLYNMKTEGRLLKGGKLPPPEGCILPISHTINNWHAWYILKYPSIKGEINNFEST